MGSVVTELNTVREGLMQRCGMPRTGRRDDSCTVVEDEVRVASEQLARVLMRVHGTGRPLGRGLPDDALLSAIEDRFREVAAEAVRLRDLIREADRRNLDWEVWENKR